MAKKLPILKGPGTKRQGMGELKMQYIKSKQGPIIEHELLHRLAAFQKLSNMNFYSIINENDFGPLPVPANLNIEALP